MASVENIEQPASPAAKSANDNRGIGTLTLRKPAAEPAPPATAPGGAEGGKGGEGGPEAPPLPPSNAAFMAAVVRGVAEGARAAVCSKAGDPQMGGWQAEAAGDIDRQCPANRNNYVNCSSFVADDDGSVQAKLERFSGYHALVLDDVGTKVPRGRIEGVTPTWEIETSPGNSQIGFSFAEPIRDKTAVDLLQSAVKAAGLSDLGAMGAARWVRLPFAVNGKEKYGDEAGHPFICRLVRWEPQATYTVDSLAAALDLTLSASPSTAKLRSEQPRSAVEAEPATDCVWTPAPVEDPVITGLKERGLYKRQVAPGRHEVTCPWVSEHTDEIDTGSVYFEPGEQFDLGGFKCHHSHGDKLHIGQLLTFLGIDPDAARAKARIRIVPGEMNRITRAAERALAHDGGYYQVGGVIVTIRTDPRSGDVSTELLSEPALTAALAEAADWQRFDKQSKRWIRTDPPARNVQLLLKAGTYGFLPPLTGLARQPFFREDGDLVAVPGYDDVSARYAAFDPAEFPMPAETEAAAREALAMLNDLLFEFRFASEEDRSASICAMLTAAVRTSLPVAPAFSITAGSPGSGKSYLASTVVPFAGPGVPFKVSYPTNAEEATKTMLAALLSTPAVLMFDDMQTDWLPHGAINRMLTSDTITDRVLGVSRMVTASTKALILGTGNNVGPVRDMCRRVVTIKLHHRVATPALQEYQGRPAEAVARGRGCYVAAALTIISAWKAAGSPMTPVPSIASYGEWSDLCRQPLLWLGLADPASSIVEQVRHDPAQDDLGHLFTEWYAAFGDAAVMLRQVVEATENNDELLEALLDLPVADRGVLNRSKLGWFLKKNANRVVGGFELQAAECSQRNAWRVVRIEPAEPSPS